MSFPRLFVGVLALALSACAAHTTNLQTARLTQYDPAQGYRFNPAKSLDPDTLVILTLSGGGMRAAALGFGALQALRGLPGTVPGSTLLDQVNLVSSVSGGSVAAGWYALHGPQGFEDANAVATYMRFLNNLGDMELAARGLNPIALTSYVFTSRQRSDVLSEYFAAHIFHGATYADIDRKYRSDPRQGYVILNSTDLGHKTRFPFTQNRFDLLCSDLDPYPVAEAVAASADFPLVFSPIGIKNFSPCPVQALDAWNTSGPGKWLADYASYEQSYPDYGGHVPVGTSEELGNLQRGLSALEDYARRSPDDTFLHLLDGGLIDNLGIRATLQIDDNPAIAPGLVFRLQRGIPPYDRIKRVLYVVVNARSSESTGLDAGVYPPDLISTAFRVAYASVDSASADAQLLLTKTLDAVGKMRHRHIEGYVATIDPGLIADQTCRNYFLRLPTRWELADSSIQALIALPQVLLASSPDLRRFYRDLGIVPRTTIDFTAACAGSRAH